MSNKIIELLTSKKNDNLTIEEIAAKKNVVPRCVYKDIDAAIERMAKLIFGVDYLINYKKT